MGETYVEDWLLSLSQSRNVAGDLLSRAIITHHGWTTRVLHIRARCAFTMLHLRAEETSGATRRLHVALRAIGRVGAEVAQKAIGAMDGVRNFRGHRLVKGNGARVALNRVVFALALDLTFAVN